MKQISILFLVFLSSFNINAQDTISLKNGKIIAAIKADPLSSQSPRNIFPLGVNGGYMFVSGLYGMFSGSIDYLFTPNISAEINFLGLFPYPSQYSFSFGGKYWFANKFSKSGFSPFAGLFYTKFMSENYEYVVENKPRWSYHNYMEVPLGISYINKFGLQTSLQLDGFLGYESNKLNIVGAFVEFRIGWRFKTGKKI